jgi:hypothetical protein
MPEPQRLPLAVKPSNRDETTNRDAKIVNGYVERVSERDIEVYKRPGYALFQNSGTAAAGLGSYNWNGDLFTIFGSKLYKNNVAVSGTVDSSAIYAFTSTLGGNPQLVFQNGVKMYTYDDTNGIAEIHSLAQIIVTGTLANGSPVVTAISPNTSGLTVGMVITGTGIPLSTKILTIDSSTQITLDQNATISNNERLTAAASVVLTGDIASGSSVITNISPNTTNLFPGMFVTATGIPTLTKVLTVDSSTQVTVDANATATTTGVSLTFETGFPLERVPGIAYLDGYINVMTPDATIWSSDANEPDSWALDSNIVAQIEADQGVYLSKQLVYVLAFKKYSIEIFYDAGNATGSPLSPVQGAKVSIGCRHPNTVSQMEGTVFWVSQARDGGTAVYLMDNVKSSQISTPSIERLLQQADYTTVYSWCARVAGHRYYCVTLAASNLSLVYDMTSQQWYQWTDNNGNYLPFVSASYTGDNQAIFQHATNGKMYQLEITNTTDEGATITMDLYTPNYDGGTRKRKSVVIMDVIADQTDGSVLQVRVSDDDYQTWSNFREVDLSKNRPMLTNCGTFRRRAYHFRHQSNTPLRIQAVELMIDLGTL